MATRGGYRPDSRIETLKDEFWITGLLLVGDSAEGQLRKLREMVRIAEKAAGLLRGNGGQPPLGFAGA